VGSLVAKGIESRPREILNGLIAIVKEEDQGDFVELWFDKRATDGFLRRIPRGGSVEYGGIGKGLKFSLLEKFFGLKKYEKRGGRIPIGAGRSYAERVLLIGDSAGQVKPWSGGGVVYGLTCSGIAAGVLDRAFQKGDFSRDFLKGYERAWRARIGGGIRAGMVFRRVYKRMGNRGIDAVFRTGKPLNFLMNKLDMDFLKKRG
jgi:flavin-dependent dehydrogenase